MADEEDDKASGDGSVKKPEAPPEPEPPKIPDVELICDGFGFMPKTAQTTKRSSSVFDKTNKVVKEMSMPDAEQKGSPCGSSTNIDIVRRYTWKTKNRMIVQVIITYVLFQQQYDYAVFSVYIYRYG